MSFGSRVLFKDVCFEIDERAKAGLVGANGTGKSTLFKLITGELSDDGGEIVKSQKARIGYMEQQACRNDENTVYGEVLTVFSELMKIENELNNIALSIEMNEGDIDSLISRQMVLNDKFERDGGLTYRAADGRRFWAWIFRK